MTRFEIENIRRFERECRQFFERAVEDSRKKKLELTRKTFHRDRLLLRRPLGHLHPHLLHPDHLHPRRFLLIR